MQEIENSLPIGTKLDDRYLIESILGEGGFGITYKAHDKELDYTVVIKEFLPQECAARSNDSVTVQARTNRSEDYDYGLQRFLEEARTLAKFQHPNIVRVSNFLKANGTAYFIMDYADGITLDQWLKTNSGNIDEKTILQIIIPLLTGLDEVHKANIMHRDIKPANIFLRKKGGPLLIDFGAARQALGEHSKSISAIISMGYAPPEQYTTRGKQGAYTDLYAVGAVMYKLITGKTPLESPDRSHDIHEGEPDPLTPAIEAGKGQVSDWLLNIIDQLLNISPKLRPQSAEAILTAIENKTTVNCAAPTQPQTQVKKENNKTRVVKSSERFAKERPASKASASKNTQETLNGLSNKKAVVLMVMAVTVIVIAVVLRQQYFLKIQSSISRNMLNIPAGSFMMGGTSKNEKPIHKVSIQAFKLNKYEVTHKQWYSVMKSHTWQFHSYSQCDDCPVENISWNGVQNFIRTLNETSGKYFRLPTESEWEYACRSGGKKEKYCGGNNMTTLAWHAGNSGNSSHPVGDKRPNGLGLYDMSGNIQEWVQDCWNSSYKGAPSNGTAWTSGDCKHHVLRGGDYTKQRTYRYANGKSIKKNKTITTRSSSRSSSKWGGFRLAHD